MWHKAKKRNALFYPQNFGVSTGNYQNKQIITKNWMNQVNSKNWHPLCLMIGMPSKKLALPAMIAARTGQFVWIYLDWSGHILELQNSWFDWDWRKAIWFQYLGRNSPVTLIFFDDIVGKCMVFFHRQGSRDSYPWDGVSFYYVDGRDSHTFGCVAVIQD